MINKSALYILGLTLIFQWACTEVAPEFETFSSSEAPALDNTQIKVSNSDWGLPILVSGQCNSIVQGVALKVGEQIPTDIKALDPNAEVKCSEEGRFSFQFPFSTNEYPGLGLQDSAGAKVMVEIYTITALVPSQAALLEILRDTSVQPPDTIPDPFLLTDQTGVSRSTDIESNVIQILGINQPTSIGVTGGQFRICSDISCTGNPSYTWIGSTVSNGDYVQVKLTSSSSYSDAKVLTLDVGTTIDTFIVTTESAPDTIPDAYNFTAAVNLELSNQTESDIVQISGITGLTSVNVSNGEYRICGDPTCSGAPAYQTSPDNITNLQYVQVRGMSASSYSSPSQVNLDVGTVIGVFNMTTKAAPDTIPDAFNFTAAVNLELSTQTESDIVQISGITGLTSVNVSNGEYRICGDPTCSGAPAYQTSPGNITNLQYVQVRGMSASSYSSPSQVNLDVGTVIGVFNMTTKAAPDTTPDAYNFTAAVNLELSTQTESDIVQISGITGLTSVNVSNGEYRICGDPTCSGAPAYQTSPGNITNLQYVQVRGMSASSYSSPSQVNLDVGTVIGVFNMTTKAAPDTVPDGYSFPAADDVPLSSEQTSSTQQITGITGQASVSVTNGEFRVCADSICSGAPPFQTSPGFVDNLEYVQVKGTASAVYDQLVQVQLDVGTVIANFDIRTLDPPDNTPDGFSFASVPGVERSTLISSNIVQITGISNGVAVSVLQGYYRVCNDISCSGAPAFVFTPGTINNNQFIQAQVLSSSNFNEGKSATVFVGTENRGFLATTMAEDTTPDTFDFTDQSNRYPTLRYKSDIIEITGINSPAPITVTGGGAPEFRTCTDASCTTEIASWTASPGLFISDGEYIQIRANANPSFGNGNITAVTLNVGGGQDTWNISNINSPPPPVGSIKDMALGSHHSCALYASGQILCWGKGSSGRLGQGNQLDYGDDEFPVSGNFVDIGGPATQIAAGGSHTCALRSDGEVLCWGEGAHGRTGYDNTTDWSDSGAETPNSRGPINFSGLKAMQVSAGQSHSCALFSNGTTGCWGNGGNGRLGLNSEDNVGDGVGASPSSFSSSPIQLGSMPPLKVVGGSDHSCALLSDGRARCWGNGSSGKLGNGLNSNYGENSGAGQKTEDSPLVTINKIKDIETKYSHNCALTTAGEVFCWGYGDSGRLGYGNISNVNDPASAGPVPLGEPAKKIAVGQYHNCAILASGNVKCWGKNDKGQLGLNHTDSIGDDETPLGSGVVNLGGQRAKAIYVGGEHSCALMVDGKVRCWGDNVSGQLGLGHNHAVGDNENPMAFPHLSLGGSEEAIKVQVGDSHSCLQVSNGTIKCWGSNLYGQLNWPAGYDTVPGSVEDLFTSGDNVCVINGSGLLECWGDGSGGQLGISSTFSAPNTAQFMDMEWLFGCGLTMTGSIDCWGDNTYGALNIPSSAPDFTSMGAIRILDLGFWHGMAITHQGILEGWDKVLADDFDQITGAPATYSGLGKARDVSGGEDFTCGVRSSDNNVACWGRDNGLGNLIVDAGLNTLGAKQISTYSEHSCGVSTAGVTYCWGKSNYSQASTPGAVTGTGSSLSVESGFQHSCTLLSTGKLHCWGRNNNGQIDVPSGH